MLDIEQKLIAAVSIVLMLIAASAVFYDRLFVAYGLSLIYAVVRWKFCEKGTIVVSSLPAKVLLQLFVVISAIVFAAGGSSLGSGFTKYTLGPGIGALIGFVLAFDIARYFTKIKTLQS